MRRRNRSVVEQASVLPPLLREPPVVEAWVGPNEMARHTFDQHCRCGDDCATSLMIVARRRHAEQVDEHLAALGVARRQSGALWGRPRWLEAPRAAS